MTFQNAIQVHGRANNIRSDAKRFQVTVIALGLLMSLAAAEWFVTYCAFSNRCPDVLAVATLPAFKLQFLVPVSGQTKAVGKVKNTGPQLIRSI
jgi:hypothetical protein